MLNVTSSKQLPTPVIARSVPVPCPHKGINAIVSLAEMDPGEALYIYNMICTQAGLQVRNGYKQWCATLPGTGGVRTLIAARGNSTAGAQDHLFACTSVGIFDVTSSSAQPATSFTAKIDNGSGSAGTTLTVSSVQSGAIAIGDYVYGAGVAAGTIITGGSGLSWTVNISQLVTPAEAMTGYSNQVVQWPVTGGNAGWCSWDHCTNLGGDEILMVCDEVNGYYTFDTNTSTWTQVTQGFQGTGQTSGATLTIQSTLVGTILVGAELYTISGGVLTDTGLHVLSGGGSTWTLSGSPTLGSGTQIALINNNSQIYGINPALFAFVRLFNNFVFFVQSGSGNSWILPVGQVYGIPAVFSFGNKFGHGGNLNSLWGFTYGSYFGTYIYLVGIGDAGDVIAYTGNNPFNANSWSMAGQWYVGDIPPGRRTATNYGGDLVILSSYGAINLSSLFYQKDINDPNAYMTKKIAPAIKSEIATAQYRGWEIVPYPNQNSMLILDPNVAYANNTYQFCYNLLTNGWSVFKGVPAQCAATWHAQLYTGGADGNVYQMFAGQDNVLLGQSSGTSINWGCLGAFNNLQAPGVLKFVDLLRAYFITDQFAPYYTFARYDFDVSDLVLGQNLGSITIPLNAWDSGIWDSTLWGVGTVAPEVVVQGTNGSGHYCAAGLVGSSNGNTTFIAFDASYRPTKSFL